MNPPSRKVGQIISDTPLAANLLARLAASRRAATAIDPICRNIAPDLDALAPGVCDLRDDVLKICLRSSALANKLRQATPRLLAGLHCNGLQINEITITVQPARVRENAPSDAKNSAEKPPSGASAVLRNESDYLGSIAFSGKLAVTLPESGLRLAAQQMEAAMRARLARMRESDQTFNKQNQGKNNSGTQPPEK